MYRRILFGVLLICVGGGATLFALFFSKVETQQVPLFKAKKEIAQDFQYAAPWDKSLYDRFYIQQKDLQITEEIKGGIVPHHLLAGHLVADFVEAIKKQKPSVIVLLSPNHFSRGTASVITTDQNWKTIYGDLKTNHTLVRGLQKNNNVVIDEKAIKEEHGIYGLIPFFVRSLPDTTVLPLILRHDISTSTMDTLVQDLKKRLPKDAVIIASVDFSHYQTPAVANFHDELSRNVIRTFDFSRLPTLEIDSVPSVYTLLKFMESFGTKRIVYEAHENAADIVRNQSQTDITSYYTPYFSKGDAATGTAISILSFGDIMLDRSVRKQIDEHGEDYLLTKLAGTEGRFFRGMDIISANMEGPFANSRRFTTKEIAFRFDPALLPMLRRYNFSLFSHANNHSYDMGGDAEKESKENMQKAGFYVYGSQYRVDDESLIIRTISQKKIAFIGINDTNTPIDEEETLRLIKKAEAEADITILNAHWGIEYENTSRERQRFLAHEFIDAGVDAVVGHHPHWVQEMEVYRDRPIFYSLGNFIFDQYFSVETQQGLAVGLVFYPDKISGYLYPLQGNQSQVTLMPFPRVEMVQKAFVDRSRLEGYTVANFHFTIPLDSYATTTTVS